MQLKDYNCSNDQTFVDSDINVKCLNIRGTCMTATENEMFIYYLSKFI